MDDETYRPRFGRDYDTWRSTDTAGDRLLDNWEGTLKGPCVPARVPCKLSPFCSQPNFHLGPCDDLERIELVTVWDGETGECFYDPSDFVEPQERPFFESEHEHRESHQVRRMQQDRCARRPLDAKRVASR